MLRVGGCRAIIMHDNSNPKALTVAVANLISHGYQPHSTGGTTAVISQDGQYVRGGFTATFGYPS